jgi:hypothetical protein
VGCEEVGGVPGYDREVTWLIWPSFDTHTHSVKSRCAAALANLATQPGNISRMVEDGVIGCLARLLANTDEGLLQSCCIALALTAFHNEVKSEMVRGGWVGLGC